MTGINVIIIITFPLVFLMDAIAELRTVKRVMHRIGCVHCTSNANHRHLMIVINIIIIVIVNSSESS